MKKKNTTKTKLVATIVSMVSALCLLAVGVFATLTNFQVAIANQLNLKFDAVEGTLYATRMGDVAGTDRTTSKVLSESTTATDWLKVYDGTTTEGVQNDALTSIQEKVDFISNDKIKEKVNAGGTSIAITYYFYYTLPTDAAANNITLTAPAVSDSNVAITYVYVKTTSATLPDFTSGTALTNGGIVQVAGGEHLFVKAEARVDLSKSVKLENVDWNFTLKFEIGEYVLNGDTLSFNAVTGAETYEVWAKQSTTSGASLLAQTSAVGDTDTTLGTLVKILDKSSLSFNLAEALTDIDTIDSGTYNIVILPKNASNAEITGNRVSLYYDHIAPQPILSESGVYTTARPIGGNYYFYVELGEYPQTVVEDTTILSALNALGDSAKTGRTFVIGGEDDEAQTAHEEYAYNGAKYVKVESAIICYGPVKFASGFVANEGQTYWFKVEPIKWFLLEAYSTTKTAYTGSIAKLRVLSEKLLTANVIYEKYVEDEICNDWGTSNMRDWLNNAFYTSAFSADDQKHIETNTTRYFYIDEAYTKDDYTTTTGGYTSEDKVWLISRYEADFTYCKDDMYLPQSVFSAKPTDFAIANNANFNRCGYGASWYRSAAGDRYSVWAISHSSDFNKAVDFENLVNDPYTGVRPALTISL